jgi:hypothetical protein
VDPTLSLSPIADAHLEPRRGEYIKYTRHRRDIVYCAFGSRGAKELRRPRDEEDGKAALCLYAYRARDALLRSRAWHFPIFRERTSPAKAPRPRARHIWTKSNGPPERCSAKRQPPAPPRCPPASLDPHEPLTPHNPASIYYKL